MAGRATRLTVLVPFAFKPSPSGGDWLICFLVDLADDNSWRHLFAWGAAMTRWQAESLACWRHIGGGSSRILAVKMPDCGKKDPRPDHR